MKKWYFTQKVEFNVEAETYEDALAIIRASGNIKGLKPLQRIGYVSEVLPYDEDGNVMESTYDKDFNTVYYTPACKFGYRDCICDPAMCVAEGLEDDIDEAKQYCNGCHDGSLYDDECK